MDANVEAAMNRHINRELFSSYLYLSMAAWCEAEGLRGFSHWMRLQSVEENVHVMKFFDFVLDRGGRVEFLELAAPQREWDSPLDVFQAALDHEREVSGYINELMDAVIDARDHAANVFLQWFVQEQVEEEATVADIVSRLQLVGEDGRGILLIDQELAARADTGEAA